MPVPGDTKLANCPQNLGRAKDIGEFVKHGSEEAEIEIELAARPKNSENPVIYRKIIKQGNKSVFKINNRSVSQKEVVRFAKRFSIQIDNLCQFLPQDRVVEFSRLEPVALLRETLRAAAPEQMVRWHEELKDLRAEEKRLEEDQTKEGAHLKQLQTKQNATREDVERHNEREKHVKRFNALKRCRPVIETNLIKKQLAEVIEERDKAKTEFRQLEAEVAPARAAQQESKSYRDQVKEIRDQRQAHVDIAKQQANKLMTYFKAGQDTITELSNQIEAEKTGERQRRQDVKRLEGVVANYDRAMQETPVEVDKEGFAEQVKHLRSIMSASERRDPELREEMQAFVAEAQSINKTIQDLTTASANLDTQSGQQANLLQRVASDTARGWNWIEKNRHTLELQGEVHGPPILTCSVVDPRFADIIENQLGGQSDAVAITCTNGRDAQLISQKLLGPEMGLHQISIRTVPRELAYYRNPLNREELKGLGFEGWALDYVQGPGPVLAMLCDSAQLHRAAYAPTQLTEEQHKAVEQSPISTWIAGRYKYKIARRREYGQTSTRVTELTKARFFTDQPVDTEKKRELGDAKEEAKRELAELQERHKRVKDEQKEEKKKHDEAKTDMVRAFPASEEPDTDMWHRKTSQGNTIGRRRPGPNGTHYQAKKVKLAEHGTTSDTNVFVAQKQGELNDMLEIARQTGNRVLEIKARSEKAALKVASLAIDYTVSPWLLLLRGFES
jgi:hypothetical protein